MNDAFHGPSVAQAARCYKGREPREDTCYPFFKRAEARRWYVVTMESGHVVQVTHTKELVELLERTP